MLLSLRLQIFPKLAPEGSLPLMLRLPWRRRLRRSSCWKGSFHRYEVLALYRYKDLVLPPDHNLDKAAVILVSEQKAEIMLALLL